MGKYSRRFIATLDHRQIAISAFEKIAANHKRGSLASYQDEQFYPIL
jgi:hypothetical protein